MKRRIPVLILVLAAAGAGFYWWWEHHGQKGLVLTGIVSTDEVDVSAQIQGRLSQLLVREGDTVKSGQLVAVIAPQEWKADAAYYAHSEEGLTSAVKQAESELTYQETQTREQIRQAEAALASSEAQVAEAKADLENARLTYQRNSGLFKQGIVAAQVNDQSRTSYEAAQAHLDSLAKQVDAQQAALALARSNEEQIKVRESQLATNEHQLAAGRAQKTKAQVQLGYTEIHAPIDGVVALRAALQGEVVNAGQAIVTLVNPDDLWVSANVEETYITGIHLGDKFPVKFPSGAVRTGTVFFRGVDAEFATQRDVSRTKRDIKTFEIRLRCDNGDRSLWPGLTAYVTVPAGE